LVLGFKTRPRIERWELGLTETPRVLPERELDICLMRKARRSVYRGGYLKFENVHYRGEYLGGYEGKFVNLRYDPEDITTVWVYYREEGKNAESFLTRAHATKMEGEKLSQREAKAASKRIRKAGRELSNESILAEIRDRAIAIEETRSQSKKARKKAENERLHSPKSEAQEVEDEGTEETSTSQPEPKKYKVWDYEDLMED